MKQDTTQDITVTHPDSARYALQNIWQIQTAQGERLWTYITWAFAAYWTLFVAGAFLHLKELNIVGGVLVLGVLAWTLVERLWVRLDGVVIASLLAAVCVPLFQSLVLSPPTPDALFKHISLCLTMAIARPLQLPIAFKSKMRGALAVQILLILFISVTIFTGSTWDGGTRHSGLFVNPNNLALIPFLLLFFVDESRDRWFIRLGAHAVVVAVLAFSGTSGAVLAYAIGLVVHFRNMVPKTFRSMISVLTVIFFLAGIVFLAMDGERFLPQTRMVHQISVIRTEFKDVINGVKIQFYEQEKTLGSGSGSAAWRLMHWRDTLTTYLDGTPAEQIFGFGIGSSPGILGVLPHNEYLRILFEQGLFGFVFFIFAWACILASAPKEVRYVGLITAIYSFSENNLDNYPFMALFILCLSARGVRERSSNAVFSRQTNNAIPLETTRASLPLLGC